MKKLMLIAIILMGIVTSGQTQVLDFYGQSDMAEPEHPAPYAPLESSLMLIPMAAGYPVAKKRGFWN